MPHYVTQLDDELLSDEEIAEERERHARGEIDAERFELAHFRYAVYSTIVDGLLTYPMSAEQMMEWLVESGRYDAWQKPYDADQVIAEWEKEKRGPVSDGMRRLWRDQANFMYWHPGGFCYVKLSDAYFVLPREAWRNGN